MLTLSSFQRCALTVAISVPKGAKWGQTWGLDVDKRHGPLVLRSDTFLKIIKHIGINILTYYNYVIISIITPLTWVNSRDSLPIWIHLSVASDFVWEIVPYRLCPNSCAKDQWWLGRSAPTFDSCNLLLKNTNKGYFSFFGWGWGTNNRPAAFRKGQTFWNSLGLECNETWQSL